MQLASKFTLERGAGLCVGPVYVCVCVRARQCVKGITCVHLCVYFPHSKFRVGSDCIMWEEAHG